MTGFQNILETIQCTLFNISFFSISHFILTTGTLWVHKQKKKLLIDDIMRLSVEKRNDDIVYFAFWKKSPVSKVKFCLYDE